MVLERHKVNMNIHLLPIIVIISTVQSLDPVNKNDSSSLYDTIPNFKKVQEFVTAATKLGTDKLKSVRRTFDNIFRSRILRDDQEKIAVMKDETAKIAELELKLALAKKMTALDERPFVEKKGKQDFLVMAEAVQDPFATVIPNNIYYNIEKKCVNWLDDCSLRGIRARLLYPHRGPF